MSFAEVAETVNYSFLICGVCLWVCVCVCVCVCVYIGRDIFFSFPLFCCKEKKTEDSTHRTPPLSIILLPLSIILALALTLILNNHLQQQKVVHTAPHPYVSFYHPHIILALALILNNHLQQQKIVHTAPHP